MTKETLIVSNDIFYPGILNDIPKSKETLQPVYEAFTNSFESLKALPAGGMAKGEITISIFLNPGTTPEDFIFDKIVIEDNGAGFNELNFDRFNRYKDSRKGYHNKGTGRIQFLHFFETSNFVSVFKDEDIFKQRSFILSKNYINRDAIISHSEPIINNTISPNTVLTLEGLLDPKDQLVYDKLTAVELKNKLIIRYMMEFCSHRARFPIIKILEYLKGKIDSNESIRKEDIPKLDKEKDINISYHKLSDDGSRFIQTGKKEPFKVTSYKINADSLDKNEIKLTSKGEVVNEPKIELRGLAPKDHLNNNRYLFLLSGEYLNNRDSDSRGVLNIHSRKEFMKENSDIQDMIGTEEIMLDDIEDKTNETITVLYDEIKSKIEDKKRDVESLRKMFLLNEKTIQAVKVGLDDSEEKILEKVYSADAKITARKDAEIKKCVQRIDTLNPTSKDYAESLNSLAAELAKAIPLQNRAALTHYIARRKLVLDVFEKILKRELSVQQAGDRNIDEKLLHNLIFQQSSNAPDESDLWIINEDFIYFKGASEERLCDVEIDGRKIFKAEFFEEEEKYLKSLGENRKIKRPDILLFPDEGKCIIIELKNPDVNISDHLHQINKYAALIRNYSEKLFNIETFYGYLIGEGILPEEVRAADSDYILAYHLDYLFRPNKNVVGERGRRDGSIYTEVIKYSTLLKRAIKRNEIFIKKLTESEKKQEGIE